MTAPPRTFTSEHLRRQRDLHARSDGYGRHRHLYLHETMRKLAREFADAGGRAPTLLDYGCGKGQFIEEMHKLALFAAITGYDPAYATFEARPSGQFDFVTCLDVLDAAEARFVDPIVADVAAHASGMAIIDCLTRPKPQSGFKPHPPHYWIEIVKRHMRVVSSEIHFFGLSTGERVAILAQPRR
jgi:2-polyprenyl-3-methyl-5-hydroxy-6-metoxy-1,4-benzoquinol methylase